jgi:hypothetical protein
VYNSQAILGISTLVVILIDVALVFKVTFASYGTIFASKKYAYSFDKSKLLMFFMIVLAAAIMLLGYGYLIAKRLNDAVDFCLINTAIISIGIFIAVTYKKKNYELKSDTKKDAQD